MENEVENPMLKEPEKNTKRHIIKNKNNVITIITIILVLVAAFCIIYFKNKAYVSESDAKFIGNNSILYVQTGCPHCLTQEKMFGNMLKYLNVVNCATEDGQQKCIDAGITAIPTWFINGEYYAGIKSVDELKELINGA